MKVTSLDRLTFRVKSTTKTDEDRFVDMAEYRGNGKCDCRKFLRIRESLEQHLKTFNLRDQFSYVPFKVHQCEHIQAVNDHIANCFVQAMRKEHGDDRQTT